MQRALCSTSLTEYFQEPHFGAITPAGFCKSTELHFCLFSEAEQFNLSQMSRRAHMNLTTDSQMNFDLTIQKTQISFSLTLSFTGLGFCPTGMHFQKSSPLIDFHFTPSILLLTPSSLLEKNQLFREVSLHHRFYMYANSIVIKNVLYLTRGNFIE